MSFCMGPIYQRKPNPTRTGTTYRAGTCRYVINRYHNTSSVSNMIEHLNWRSLVTRRTDARLVKISHELVTIHKKDILLSDVLVASRILICCEILKMGFQNSNSYLKYK